MRSLVVPVGYDRLGRRTNILIVFTLFFFLSLLSHFPDCYGAVSVGSSSEVQVPEKKIKVFQRRRFCQRNSEQDLSVWTGRF